MLEILYKNVHYIKLEEVHHTISFLFRSLYCAGRHFKFFLVLEYFSTISRYHRFNPRFWLFCMGAYAIPSSPLWKNACTLRILLRLYFLQKVFLIPSFLRLSLLGPSFLWASYSPVEFPGTFLWNLSLYPYLKPPHPKPHLLCLPSWASTLNKPSSYPYLRVITTLIFPNT